ncbi:response regulator transcription factor [Blastococcus deserti]|uniref:Response regulator transcription factor n=1 Tax=Blastococcus deserti TaxID=2259033 RepID=A0ABW4XBH7_9ACTN
MSARAQRRPSRRVEDAGPQPLRLLLADPHLAFVEALAPRLSAEPGLRVVGTVTRPEDALRVVRTRPVDVALLAVDGTGSQFVDAAGALADERPELALAALAEADDVGTVARVVRMGFRGWVPKDLDVAALVVVLEGIRRGETHIPPALLTRLLPHLLREQEERRAAERPFATLTPREREVLRAMCRGATRQEIAEELEVSHNTVRTHLQKILGKLGLHSSLAAVTLARKAGFD